MFLEDLLSILKINPMFLREDLCFRQRRCRLDVICHNFSPEAVTTLSVDLQISTYMGIGVPDCHPYHYSALAIGA